eukprot:scaffold3581_cov417-Prasinococcus_capsulatus_cf.AAC.11
MSLTGRHVPAALVGCCPFARKCTGGAVARGRGLRRLQGRSDSTLLADHSSDRGPWRHKGCGPGVSVTYAARTLVRVGRGPGPVWRGLRQVARYRELGVQ